MRFLIVDDSDVPLKFLERFLTQAGHQVAGVARNGQEAVEQVERLNPDEALSCKLLLVSLNFSFGLLLFICKN